LISGNSIITQGTDANIPLTLQTKGTSSFAINTGATPTSRLTITNAGAVNIPGTLSAGATTITGNSAVIGTLEVGAATAELLISGNSIITQGTDANIPLTLQTKGTSSFAINTGTTPTSRLTITDAGNVGIGTITIQSSYKLQVQGNTWVENQLVFNNLYRGSGADFACNKIALYNGGNTPTTTANNGFGIATSGVEYFSGLNHMFYTGTTGGTGYGTERMRIDNTGAITIGGTLSAGATTITGNSVVVGTLEVGAATAELLISGNSIITQGTDANIPLTLQTKGTSGFAINTGATPTSRLTITNAGAVNIPGTLSAGATTITGNSAVIGTLEVGAATAELLISGNSIITQGTDANIPLTLQTKGTSGFAINTGATPTSRLTITDAGNIGIGNISPIGPLCIGNASVASSDGFLVLGKRDASTTSRQFKIGISDTNFEFVIGNFGVNNVAATWVQQFKIANSAPANSIIVDGTGGLSVFGNITSYYSDERLKTKTANISDSLKIIDKLNGFYYTPNKLAHSFGIKNNKQEIGLSAQEVQKVLPELVDIAPFDLEKDKDGNMTSKSGEKYLTLAYDRLAPIFVEAIKELNQKNILLTNENNELKDKYNKLLEDITLIKQTLNLI
jgi:hypothetical protein